MKDLDASPLRPSVPRNESPKNKSEAGNDETSRAQPSLFALSGKEKLGELYGNKDHPNTFIAEGPQEVDPVHAPYPSICVSRDKRGDRSLLNHPFLRNSQRKAQ